MLIAILLTQAAIAVAPAPAAAQQGVISYPPSFFAAQQPANAMEMLDRLPGFSLDTGDSVRGFEGGGGNALIDGQRPVSKTDDLEEILRRIPASQVERIDLIRGGAPGIDMQGKTVIANVIKRQGAASFRGLVALANNHIYDGRDLYGARLELSGGKNRRNWEATARFGFGADDGAGDGPGLQLGPTGAPIRRSRIDAEGDGGNYTLTGAWEQPLAGGKIRINARHFGDKFKYENDEVVSFPTVFTESTDDSNRRFENEIGVRYERSLSARASVELVGLNQTRDRELVSRFTKPSGVSAFSLERETRETIGRAVLRYRWNEQVSLEAGAEAAQNQLDSLTALSVNGADQRLPAANVTVEENRGELFGKATWRMSPQWTFEGGLRYEGSDIGSDGDVVLSKTLYFAKPRLAATWAPTEHTQIRARFERVVGQLRFGDFVASTNFAGVGVTVGNPDLDPEQAWVSEAAFEQRFAGDGVASLTYRHSALKDVIDRGPVTGSTGTFDRPTNIGDGTKDELIANLTLPLDRIGLKGGQLKGDVTLRDSKVTDPTTGRSREISGLRPMDWNATFTQDIPSWNMSYGVEAYGGWRETYYRFNSIETVKLRTYVKPFAEWRVQPDLMVRMELPNVTARGLKRTLALYDGPRSANPNPTRVEVRDYQFGRMVYVRVRKTFG